MVAFSLL